MTDLKKTIDEYGFATTALVALEMFEGMQRGSGRSTRLVERVSAGDLIVAASAREADRYARNLREANLDVQVTWVEPGRPEDLYKKLQGHEIARLHFTHEFQRLSIVAAIRAADLQLAAIVSRVSRGKEPAGECGIDREDETRLTYLHHIKGV